MPCISSFTRSGPRNRGEEKEERRESRGRGCSGNRGESSKKKFHLHGAGMSLVTGLIFITRVGALHVYGRTVSVMRPTKKFNFFILMT